MRRAAMLGVLGASLVTACTDSGTNISGVPDLSIVRVEVFPTLDTLFVADTLRPTDRLQMAAAVIGRTGSPISGAAVAWSSENPEVAVVTESGLVIPTGYGTTRILASASKVAKATIVVEPATRVVTVSPGADTIFVEDPFAPRDTIRLKATARDEEGKVITGVVFSWSSNGAGMATVDGTGLVLGRGLGTVSVTATAGGQSGTANVMVASVVKSIQASSPVLTVLARDTVQLTATAFGWDDKPMAGRSFTWSSSNQNVATVDPATGRAIFKAAGPVTFTAKSAQTTSAVTVTALERQLLAVDVGDDLSCGYTNLGRGYCWGVGDLGQLGSAADSSCFEQESTQNKPCTLAPKRFDGPAIEFLTVSAGDSVACGVSSANLLYCWGDDTQGEIGNGRDGGSGRPALATVAQERFATVTAGAAHACALTLDGRAFCWGRDFEGQLGDNRFINSTTPIPVFGSLRFSAISAGDRHTCGIANNTAYCWGENQFGQLGNGTAGLPSAAPIPVTGAQNVAAIAAGGRHTCALTTAGAVLCWGANDRGQVGIGTTGDAPVVTPAATSSGPFVQISGGRDHTCALTAVGTVSCWGDASWGQVGSGVELQSITTPTAVVGGISFKSVTAGRRHSCGVANDGETYCWGSNVFGALGNELQAASRATPQRVAVPR